ncbi:hypothetical protein LCGC14_2328720 [marine sediment metagenome]|uniref:Uncharacterized protein n=1 Tax=marine sediment metagenome TaxID=412755 RepID=A0A0F9D319_9ZZZZ
MKTIQEARKELNDTRDDALVCPSCYDVLKECDGGEGEQNYLMCTNEMCLDQTSYVRGK